MKLYVNHDQTQWRGTQADAKSAFGSIDTIDVPTDKAGLLEFLNNFTVKTTEIDTSADKFTPAEPTPAVKPENTLVGCCSLVELKELSTTLRVLLNRTWSEMEKQERS